MSDDTRMVYIGGLPGGIDSASAQRALNARRTVVGELTVVDRGSHSFAFAVVVDGDVDAFVQSINQSAFGSIIGSRKLTAKRYERPHHIPRAALLGDKSQPSDADHDEGVTQFVAHLRDKITLVETAAQLQSAVAELSRERVLGFDTERRPTFERGAPLRRPAVLQLASRTAVYVVRLLSFVGAQAEHHAAAVDALLALLGSTQTLKCGVGVDGDVLGLCATFPTLRPAGFVRLEELAHRASCVFCCYRATAQRSHR